MICRHAGRSPTFSAVGAANIKKIPAQIRPGTIPAVAAIRTLMINPPNSANVGSRVRLPKPPPLSGELLCAPPRSLRKPSSSRRAVLWTSCRVRSSPAVAGGPASEGVSPPPPTTTPPPSRPLSSIAPVAASPDAVIALPPPTLCRAMAAGVRRRRMAGRTATLRISRVIPMRIFCIPASSGPAFSRDVNAA
jgi:hypothetical protein